MSSNDSDPTYRIKRKAATPEHRPPKEMRSQTQVRMRIRMVAFFISITLDSSSNAAHTPWSAVPSSSEWGPCPYSDSLAKRITPYGPCIQRERLEVATPAAHRGMGCFLARRKKTVRTFCFYRKCEKSLPRKPFFPYSVLPFPLWTHFPCSCVQGELFSDYIELLLQK